MNSNVGKTDGTIRVITGIGLISCGIFKKSWKIGLLGVSPLITGLAGYCPINKMLGINTCKSEQDTLANTIKSSTSDKVADENEKKHLVGIADVRA